jgi:hypothetical protein
MRRLAVGDVFATTASRPVGMQAESGRTQALFFRSQQRCPSVSRRRFEGRVRCEQGVEALTALTSLQSLHVSLGGAPSPQKYRSLCALSHIRELRIVGLMKTPAADMHCIRSLSLLTSLHVTYGCTSLHRVSDLASSGGFGRETFQLFQPYGVLPAGGARGAATAAVFRLEGAVTERRQRVPRGAAAVEPAHAAAGGASSGRAVSRSHVSALVAAAVQALLEPRLPGR